MKYLQSKKLKFFIFIILLISTTIIKSQEFQVKSQLQKNIAFATYLINTEQYNETILLINSLKSDSLSVENADTINYLKGWAFYNLKDLDSSSYFLLKVSQASSLYLKSQFFAAYNNTFLQKTTTAQIILNKLNVTAQLGELKSVQLAGISLLNRDYDAYDQYHQTFTKNWYTLTNEEKAVDEIANQLKQYKPKSMVVAGLMSAIIPGSGKIYTGKIGEGISALISNSILGMITIENYRKDGLNNFKTIFFGSLFSIFYIGNIYGSMISVNISNNEFYASHDKKLLLNIHIPLRTIFN